jgi:hypothetical protein
MNEAVPLENWPYGALGDETVDRIQLALDLPSAQLWMARGSVRAGATLGRTDDFKKLSKKLSDIRPRNRRDHHDITLFGTLIK